MGALRAADQVHHHTAWYRRVMCLYGFLCSPHCQCRRIPSQRWTPMGFFIYSFIYNPGAPPGFSILVKQLILFYKQFLFMS